MVDDRRNADVMATLMSQLTKDIGSLVDAQRSMSDKIDRINDGQVRMEERQQVLATKEELLKVESSLREMVLPAQRDATAAHTRLDAHEIDFAEIDKKIEKVEDDVVRRIQRVQTVHDDAMIKVASSAEVAKLDTDLRDLVKEVTTLRIGWGKLTGAAAVAGLLGGSVGAFAKGVVG